MKLDTDHDGLLTMKELIPVIFSKANKEQTHLIVRYCEAQLIKSMDSDAIFKISPTDIDQLFGASSPPSFLPSLPACSLSP